MTCNSSINDFSDLVQRLKEIENMGFIRTHRQGNTGIGKTLEDILGIEENNVPSPNAAKVELKSARKNAKSMLTLFTKSPLPRKANSALLERYGYPSKRGNDRKELHTTVNAIAYNTLKGKVGFKIDIKKDRIELVTPTQSKDSLSKEVLGYWTNDVLQASFERKLPKLLYVKADSRGNGANETFWYNEAWLLSGFSFENFLNLLKKGKILIDIRIGQYPDGRPHDHGTGFRVLPDRLDLCFSHREKII